MQTKPAIEQLTPYKVKDVDYTIKLDANESANYLFKDGIDLSDIDINFYPDTNSTFLRETLGAYFDMSADNLMVGSGSSELIELIIKTYIAPGEKVLSFAPSFTMYEVYTTIHNGSYETLPVESDMSFDIDKLIEKANEINPKLIILCTPNNPTGYQTPKEQIKKLIDNTDALILLDEAYMDFTDGSSSFLRETPFYDNLIVARTFSKAFGLAGARLGYISAGLPIIKSLLKVKTPYNVNALTQNLGIQALKKKPLVVDYINDVIARREALKISLKDLGLTVYPSRANFLFVESPLKALDKRLLTYGILVRNFAEFNEGFYRISVGDQSQNKALISALKEILS